MRKFFNTRFFTLFLVLFSFGLGAFITRIGEEDISAEMIQNAAQLIGLEFSQAEVDSMRPNLEGNLEIYQALRKESIPNELAPSLVFNPLPQGFEIPKEQKPILWSKSKGMKRPKDPEKLAFLTVRELAELIETRQITSEELCTFFIQRLKKYDPQLHCVISLTEELALKQARKADQEIAAGRYRGLLHGIPYGAKDLLAVPGYKTTWGSAAHKDQVIDEKAAVVEKLEEAGAVLVAKLSLGALAWGDVWFGAKTRNPWDTKRGSSGSSAGSASAVSAGLLPFAIGTETLGSIVSPSTECGVTGLRPTFGQVSRFGAMALSWSMDKIGPICRSVEDCAIVFNAIRGKDARDASTLSSAFNYEANSDLKKIRVGYLKSRIEGDRKYRFQAYDQASIAQLKALGIELVPIELPELAPLTFLLSVEAAAAFDELTRSGKDDKLVRQIRNAWPNVFRQARLVPAVEYLQANRLRTQLIEDMHTEVFSKVDVYIAPSWGSSSLGITNLTGHPCVVLPNGFLASGRPSSMTVVGALFEEGKALRVAQAFQEATDFHLKHPKL